MSLSAHMEEVKGTDSMDEPILFSNVRNADILKKLGLTREPQIFCKNNELQSHESSSTI